MSYKVYHWCLVPKCKSSSVKTPEKLWIQVPFDIKMRKTWLELARRDPKSLSKKSRLYFCEDHFDLENDMENYTKYKIMGSVKQIRMKPNCVPSRFDWHADSPDPDRKCKSTPSEPLHSSLKRPRMSTINEIETAQNKNCSQAAIANLPESKDPLNLEQCRFCGEFTKDCIGVTSEKPYLANNRTSITLNGLTVDLDFNNTLPKTICRYCDGKLQELYDFVNQVKAAQDTLINVAEERREEFETLIIKTESPEDNKEGIVDSAQDTLIDFAEEKREETENITIKLESCSPTPEDDTNEDFTVSETEYVKPHKRMCGSNSQSEIDKTKVKDKKTKKQKLKEQIDKTKINKDKKTKKQKIKGHSKCEAVLRQLGGVKGLSSITPHIVVGNSSVLIPASFCQINNIDK